MNDDNVASFHIRRAGKAWRKIISYEVSSYHHNLADGFLSLRPALFVSGAGQARFSNLLYRGRGGEGA